MRPWHRDVFRSNSGDFGGMIYEAEALAEVGARICVRGDKEERKRGNAGKRKFLPRRAITATPRLATHIQGSINKPRKYRHRLPSTFEKS